MGIQSYLSCIGCKEIHTTSNPVWVRLVQTYGYQGLVYRERKMRTKFFCTNFLNTARGPGHPGKNPGTSLIPPFETQGRQTFKGGHEVFGHHPFARKTPTPPGGLRTQKVNLCALFSCLSVDVFVPFSAVSNENQVARSSGDSPF